MMVLTRWIRLASILKALLYLVVIPYSGQSFARVQPTTPTIKDSIRRTPSWPGWENGRHITYQISIGGLSTAEIAITPTTVYDEWFSYVFIGGGGFLSKFPPKLISEGRTTTTPLLHIRTAQPDEGEGCVGEEDVVYTYDLIRAVGRLRERVIAAKRPSMITYQVDNPSWFTGFPVRHHFGCVTFSSSSGVSVEVDWKVYYDPLPLGAWWTKSLLNIIIPTLMANLKQHMEGEERKEGQRSE